MKHDEIPPTWKGWRYASRGRKRHFFKLYDVDMRKPYREYISLCGQVHIKLRSKKFVSQEGPQDCKRCQNILDKHVKDIS